MLNPGLIKLITNKPEAEAIAVLESFQRKWRVYAKDGAVYASPPDRDDKRFGLVIDEGIVVRVIAG